MEPMRGISNTYGFAAASQYSFNILLQLKGFCYAATTGSITKAAERMLLTQPSVSLQIRALEDSAHKPRPIAEPGARSRRAA